MSYDNKKHDWSKEQPHDAKTGLIVSEEYARKHPENVEWVKGKK